MLPKASRPSLGRRGPARPSADPGTQSPCTGRTNRPPGADRRGHLRPSPETANGSSTAARPAALGSTARPAHA